MHCFDDIKGLSSVSATYDNVLTDEDIRVIRDDFYLSFNRGHMEKVAVNVIVFIVSAGFAHTLPYSLKNKPLPSQRKGKEKLMELLDHIVSVDELQIVLQSKVK
jgi:hypothetical protein